MKLDSSKTHFHDDDDYEWRMENFFEFMTDIVEPSEKFTILLKLCEFPHFQHQAHTLPLTTQLNSWSTYSIF